MAAPAFERFVGTTVAGQYDIRHVLGSGGMGAVFAAIDRTLERDVAVKLILPEQWGDPDAATRLLREARIAASFQHDNIVRVYTAGFDADGDVFFVQELLHGSSLAQDMLISHPRPRQVMSRASAPASA